MSELKGERKMTICVLGDSVAKGVVYDEVKNKYKFIKDSFVNLFSKEEKIEVKNFAKFGCTVMKGEEILQKHLDEIKGYEYVILEFGGNDCNFNWKEISEDPDGEHNPQVPVDKFKVEYKKIIEIIKEQGCKPILLSLPPLNADRFFNWISKGLSKENIMKFLGNKEYIYRWHELYNSTIFDLAKEEKVEVLDIRKVFLPYRDYEQFICIDGMHPNEKGHQLINKALLDYNIIPVL